VLLTKHCPYTGVVNFYEASEPHIAIGSITKCGTSAAGDGYTWRFYAIDGVPAGHAPDEVSAEQQLLAFASKSRRERVLELH
jgi:hypothetical protein